MLGRSRPSWPHLTIFCISANTRNKSQGRGCSRARMPSWIVASNLGSAQHRYSITAYNDRRVYANFLLQGSGRWVKAKAGVGRSPSCAHRGFGINLLASRTWSLLIRKKAYQDPAKLVLSNPLPAPHERSDERPTDALQRSANIVKATGERGNYGNKGVMAVAKKMP